MVTLFQPGAARIAGQLLANGTLMQVGAGVHGTRGAERKRVCDRMPELVSVACRSGSHPTRRCSATTCHRATRACPCCLQRLRDFDADAVMSVGLSIGGPVADNSGCLLAHALGVQAVDVSGNTFFEAPWNVPQVGCGRGACGRRVCR